MATPKITEALQLETAALVRGRPLMIELHAGYFTLREKGRRQVVSIDYAAALDLGYKLLARAAVPASKPHRRKSVFITKGSK
jgi:hypothetical protein